MSSHAENERVRRLLLSYPAGAIKELHHLYHTRMVAFAQSLTLDQDVAKDIVQETFTHLWENARKLAAHHDKSIEHYIVRVVKIKCITHYKKTRKLQENNILLLRALKQDRDDSPEVSMIKNEVSLEIRQLIDSLPHNEKICLVMQIDQGKKVDEIAAHLSLSVKAVEKRLTKAKKLLRNYWHAMNKPILRPPK